MDYRIISIGTLSANDLWHERTAVRTAHATTTLVRSQDRVIVIDPGLPPQVIAARLTERAGLEPTAVTDVFLTNFRPAHRWGLEAFSHAQWWVGDAERESIGPMLIEQFKGEKNDQARGVLQKEIDLLQRCKPAADRLAPQVDLFPLPGFTPGTCGLILKHPSSTTLIAGDAVATVEHLEGGRVLKGCYDTAAARDSFLEAIEIADVLIPGHDNLIINPTRRAF